MEGGEGKTTTLHGEPSNSTAPPPLLEEEEVDRDMLCPVCMQIMKDAFLTPCGHSFCYMCITTHLNTKSNCPCCSHSLTANNLYPNFLLNKLLVRACTRRMAKTAGTPSEQLRQALQQECDMSVKELDSLLSLISEKKKKMEHEEAETDLHILVDFMHCLRKKQVDELNEIEEDLHYINEDILPVEGSWEDLYWRKDRNSKKLEVLSVDLCRATDTSDQIKKANARSLENTLTLRRDNQESKNATNLLMVLTRKRRIHAQFKNLQDCYLQKRRARQSGEHDLNGINREGDTRGLEEFKSILSTFTRYGKFQVVAQLRHGDLFHLDNIVSSIEFDRDDEFFATAGASQRIEIFEFSTAVNEPDIRPVAEMSTETKLTCLSWNKYTKNHIASSDYEGMVNIWDVNTRQSLMEYKEHEKCTWSIDFSHKEPSMLVSGSDDYKVKVWCTNQEASVLNIDMEASICSVKYNPGSSNHVAVGSADHNIHYYDLRKTDQPLYILRGHTKAVSHVNFLSNHEIASASTDSTLYLWDVNKNIQLRKFSGHRNDYNFVGLTVNSEFIACGSETNEVFAYHKEMCRPVVSLSFSTDQFETEENPGRDFISAVCWKNDNRTMLAANSQGMMKVLALVP